MIDEQLNNEENLLELSDEEIMNLDLDQLTSEAQDEEGDVPSESSDVVEDNEVFDSEDVSEDIDDTDTASDVSGDTGADTDDTEEVVETADVFDDEGEEPSDEEESEAEPEAEAEDDSNGINYKAEYEKLLAPFKANGKDMKVDTVDEAITLMQMGANYNKKMAGLKPNLKLLKMLENNGLLAEDKLNYLIDLDKKNPDAIKNLIKESGLDPLDIDNEQQTSYKPQSYTVNDKEVELDSVLEEIQDTPSYSKTIDIVSNKWDAASRKIIVEHPQIIKLINEHMQQGIYAQIEAVIEKERMLGRLDGVSDLEAYRRIGDQIYASGEFSQQSPQAETPAPVKSTPKSKATRDPKVSSRKRAAAPTKSAPTTSAKDDFNPLSMSDDEFDKLVASKFV